MELIVTHDMADFDALAATVAAQKLHPGAVIVLGHRLGHEVREYLSLHKDRFATSFYTDLDPEGVRHLIVVDVRRKSRLGDFARLVERAERGELRVTVYDHHPAADDDLRADRAVVELVGSATTLLVELMADQDLRLDELEATLLCLGLHADTGSLTYSGTTARDAHALGWLLEQGASLPVMNRFLRPAFSAEQRALLAELLGALEVERIGHLDVAFVDACRQFEELLGQLVRDADLAARDVVRRQPHQDGNDLPRILDLTAQFAGAPIGLPYFRHGIAEAGLEREGSRHLQFELDTATHRVVRHRRQQRQTPLGKPTGLLMRVQA